ncbi:MAG TPA: alpha-2-macroglobulin family protein [Pyrinomonadaceae bacterium]|nr:alpha-2-macroglobulin family protein [Pyrinomonadaceae bacterium]
MTLSRLLALLLVYSFLLTNIPVVQASPIAIPGVTQADETDQAPHGLKFRLSEVPDQPTASPTPNVAPAQTLSVTETSQILKALPPIVEDTEDNPFRIRERTMPPPRTGKTINVSFPAREQIAPPGTRSPAALEVVRYAPLGDVPIAPALSVTFSQPMVALSSLEEAAANVPVNISPRVEGKWRWLSPTTLVFEAQNRFPMATDYTVSVPAGTQSATGSFLRVAKSWDFNTPPPTIKKTNVASSPVQRRDKIIFIEFDQRINPADVLAKIKLSHGNTVFATRLATLAEIESDEDARNFVSIAQKDRWIAFRAINKETGNAHLALPPEASISISVEPGTPSAEGPKTTTVAQKLSFQTFGPLRLVNHTCGYSGGDTCSTDNPFTLAFTNPIDEKQFKERDIRIEPAIPNVQFYQYGPVIQISGTKKPNTRYTVTINSLLDTFGQNIEKPTAVTFKIGPALPWFRVGSEQMIVLDPDGPRSVPLFTIGAQKLAVELYSVQPEDWVKFARYKVWLAHQRNHPEPPRPGPLVFSRELNFPSSDGSIVQTTIDLSPALKDKLGQVVVFARQITAEPKVEKTQDTQMVWVQSTRIGLAALVDREEMIAWASSLTNGAPLAKVQTRLLSSKQELQTGPDGLARLELPVQTDPHGALLIARLNDDVAILPENTSWYSSDSLWEKRTAADSLVWYVFDDRGLYRPGEQVHFKGWVRRLAGRKGGDLGLIGGTVQSVDYVVEDARDNEITKGTLRLNAFGAFDLKIDLPATLNLGEASLRLELAGADKSLDGRSKNHEFDVQEFRRPEFEIKTKAVTDGPFFIGDQAEVVVSANYFAGGPLPSAPVTWNVVAGYGNFTPPNRDDFNFGKWSSWWDDQGYSSYDSVNQSLIGQTNSSGNHRLRLNFDSVKPAYASSLTAEASVTDVNRQTWTSRVNLLVHPASVYVGLRSKKMFVQQGEPLVVESIVTDLDGRAVAGTDISMQATLLEWKQVDGNWQEVEAGSEDCRQRSGLEVTRCTFASKEGGAYRVTAMIRDSQGRRSDSEIRLWVAGGKKLSANVDAEDVQMIPQAKEYKPGDVAEVMIQAPFYPAEGLMTVGRSGMVKSERFTMDGPTHTLRIPIVEEWTPNINVKVDLVGLQEREPAANVDAKAAKPQKQPAYATGDIDLSIPPIMRRLSIAAVPRETTLQPGGSTTIDVEVKNAAGEPAGGSEVAVVVVDEAVLAMIDYQLRDPLITFYQFRESDVDDYHSRAYVLLSNEGEDSGTAGGVGGGASLGSVTQTVEVSALQTDGRVFRDANFIIQTESEAKPKISLRKNFDALAVFAPSVRTDANGRAQVEVKLPDNLTRYRVMAVAVDATKRFGTGESAITARSPLMVRPSAPRFLNFGDRFELPVVIQNQTDQAMIVDMAVRATNAGFPGDSTQPVTQPAQSAGRRVTVPANNRVELRIPAAVTRTGTARFQVAAVSGNWSDAAEVSLPVWTPATTEAFAAYGEIDEGSISQPVKAPANVFMEFGGLEVQTSSTQLQELTDAFLYLQNYPYECSEQIASRILSVAALRDVLSAFKAKDLPSPAEIEAAVARDLKLLQGMQNEDGGYGFWRRNEPSWPFLSLHVAHALARAKEKKFDVPEETLMRSLHYLKNIENNIPKEYSEDTRRALKAYALYVRAHMNDLDAAAARKLIKDAGLENLSLEAVGWLLYVLSGDPDSAAEIEAIRNLLNNKAIETAGAAHFVSSYKDGDYLLLHSNRRGDGIILEALIKDQPGNELIPKIVRGLLAHRTKGRWENTQENAFILLALDRYFETYEKTTPDFTARVWLGQSYAGEQVFRGRSTDRQQINVPMSELAGKNSQPELIVAKEGPGRLYYRLGMQYAPSNLSLKPADYGFVVQRSYEAIDKPEDLKRDADGTWRVKAGARIRVRVKMIAPTRRYHVALVDPLPAGFETLNPDLAVTGKLPAHVQQAVVELGSPSYGMDRWIYDPVWFEHQNFRDERTEAFTSLLWDGVYNYSYVVRATTPGTFIVPPAKAEEMYHPETFGRGGTDRVVIE